MPDINAKQFKTEFITQAEATILPRVTMTQFMLIVALAGLFYGVLDISIWLSPIPIISGYVAGYRYNGELVSKRVLAFFLIFCRQHLGQPRKLNLQLTWDSHEVKHLRKKAEL